MWVVLFWGVGGGFCCGWWVGGLCGGWWGEVDCFVFGGGGGCWVRGVLFGGLFEVFGVFGCGGVVCCCGIWFVGGGFWGCVVGVVVCGGVGLVVGGFVGCVCGVVCCLGVGGVVVCVVCGVGFGGG
ncbi:hypothetical protein VSS95_27920, partial [Pseudomonas syringae pv. tagetis]